MNTQRNRQSAFDATYGTPMAAYADLERRISHAPIVLRRNLQPRSRSIISRNRKLQYLGKALYYVVHVIMG